jgi:SAM-dependent methyltransferase
MMLAAHVDIDLELTSSASRIAALEPTHFWFVGRNVLFRRLVNRLRDQADILKNAQSKSWRVGDVGFGTGRFAAELSENGAEVFAVDTVAKPPLPLGPGYAQADGARLPWRDRCLDLVILRDVLEHGDDGRILDEARRVLHNDGTLLMSVPAWPSLWGERDRVAGHLRRYTRRRLLELVREHGFEPIEVRGYPFLLLPAFVLARRKTRHHGADLRTEEIIHPALNAALRAVTTFEGNLARFPRLRPPVGSSLIVVAVIR